MSQDGSESGRFVVRCRGLPWSTTAEEIRDFFSECDVEDDNIHVMTTREGRPSGEAYIELSTEDDLEKALKKDREHMGKRYVEVFQAKYSEMEYVLSRQKNEAGGSGMGGGFGASSSDGDDTFIRLRGLPFECTKDDIRQFFKGLEITNNGILMTVDYQGRSTGEAFVQFGNKDDTERALEKNRETIGHRYIEVFRSSASEASRGSDGGRGGRGGGGGGSGGGRDFYGGGGGGGGGGGRRPGPYDRVPVHSLGRGYGNFGPGAGRPPRGMKGYDNFYDDGYDGGRHGGGGGYMGRGGGFGGMGGGGGPGGGRPHYGGAAGGPRHIVRMRGLPFRVTETDIAEWFSSVVDPIDVMLSYNDAGKPSGEADVAFASESDARKAMTKDRQNIQHRYVELFYTPPSGGGFGRDNRSGGFSRGLMPSAYSGYDGQYS